MDGPAWINRLSRRAKRLSIDIDASTSEAIDYLKRRGGEAVTLPMPDGGYVLFFQEERPTASAVLEEFSHVVQHEQERFADRPLAELQLLRDIEVHECLDTHAARLRLPDEERRHTVALLAREREQLRELEDWRR